MLARPAATASPRPPSAWMRATTAAARSGSPRYATTTAAPAPASCSDMAAPISRLPPVTIAPLPSNDDTPVLSQLTPLSSARRAGHVARARPHAPRPRTPGRASFVRAGAGDDQQQLTAVTGFATASITGGYYPSGDLCAREHSVRPARRRWPAPARGRRPPP